MKHYRIDVNIVDHHTMVGQGLTDAINRSSSIHVSRTFNTLEACRQTLQERRPDVLLLDIPTAVSEGIDFCKEIITAYPKMKIIAVTIHDEYPVIQRMLETGVHGYVLKYSPVEQLTEAIIRVWQGERYICQKTQAVISRSQQRMVALTPVERNILRLICDGLTNPQTANRLSLSTETVNWYRKRILTKFGVSNTVNLVRLVLKEKLL